MKKSKYLSFIEQEPKAKTKVFAVVNKLSNGLLGSIMWYAPWRKYCFYTAAHSLVFDASCLTDIRDFMDELMEDHKKRLDYSILLRRIVKKEGISLDAAREKYGNLTCKQWQEVLKDG